MLEILVFAGSIWLMISVVRVTMTVWGSLYKGYFIPDYLPFVWLIKRNRAKKEAEAKEKARQERVALHRAERAAYVELRRNVQEYI